MISKSQIKLITSLQQKKYREKEGLFFAEGPKIIQDLLASGAKLHTLFAAENFLNTEKYVSVSNSDLKKISSLKTPHIGLALFFIPKQPKVKFKGLIVALDSVRDPGNLGTIIRLCDWFGVTHLLCSKDTVDSYNTKVVQASMGSIARVSISYVNLSKTLKTTNLPLYAAVMNGTSVYDTKLPKDAILVMGNEANGISDTLQQMISNKISIPQFGISKETESLNVATATAVLLSEFMRSTGT